jgi:ATP-dependent protease ClpP protease subunit
MGVPALLTRAEPHIRLYGTVDEATLSEFFRQQSEAPTEIPLVFELSTSGGDADTGRRIADELGLWREQGREIFFLGKTYVFSAGITIMSAIPPDHRYLTAGTELLIHERKMDQALQLRGSLRACRSTIHNMLAEIESGQRLERDGFSKLVEGTPLTVDDILKKVMDRDWYLTAHEARELGLIAGVV